MTKLTVEKYEGILDKIIESGLSIPEYCEEFNQNIKTLYIQMSNLKKDNSIDPETKERVLNKYESVKGVSRNKNEETIETVEDVETDDKAKTEIVRNDDGEITAYRFCIFRKGKNPFVGELSRDEMDLIHRLYSYYGDSLTQRVISRHFPQFSLIDFKRILRAFNITKASAPFARHMFEEKSEDELREIQLREKENSFLRKAEEDQIKNNEKLLKKYAQENIELKKQLEACANFKVEISGDIQPVLFDPLKNDSIDVLNLYLADIHLGATVTTGTMYMENIDYGITEAKLRLTRVLENIKSMNLEFDRINIILMGDNIDCAGFTGRTARLDHYMPENMDAREQANFFINLILWFIDSLVMNNFAEKYSVYSVPCGNHGGNFEYMCNKALLATINAKYPFVKTTMWEEFYGVFKEGNHTFICCHGKDDQYMKKGLPLNLDDKTKVQLYEWLDFNDIHGRNIHFVKGDLHSNSLNSCKKLDYRNVLSLFGASDYSNYNFSRNSYGVSYDLIREGQLLRGVFENL